MSRRKNGDKRGESEYSIVNRNWQRYQYGKDRGHFDYIEQARLCEDFYLGAGLQWSEMDRAYLDLIGRPALEQNHIFPAVNTAKGLQLQGRVDIAFKPAREGSTEDTAAMLGKISMQLCDDIQFRWNETQVFDDGMIQRRGFFEFKMDFDTNIAGDITCDVLNPLHVIPDPDASGYDPMSWADVIVLRWLTIDEIERLYGAKKAEQVNMEIGSSIRADIDLDLEEMQGFAQEGGLSVATMGEGALTDETSTKRVLVIDRQYKQLEMADVVVYPAGDVYPVDTMTPEQLAHADSIGCERARRYVNRVRWTVTTADTVLHDDWSPYRTYTVVPYFPYFRRGRTRGMVDNAISPQIAHNKIISATVHILNSTANSGWVVDQGALVNMTVDQLSDFGSQTGVVIEKKRGTTVEKIQSNQLPTGHDRLLDRSEYAIKTITGMSDALQGLNGPEVSGKAITSKQWMGQAQLGGPLDNLARTRYLAAKKILELIQDFYTDRRVILIVDESDPAETRFEQVVINDVDEAGNVLNDLSIGEYSVIVTDQPTQATFLDNQFQQAIEMREKGVQIPDTAIIQMSSLSKKQQIIKAMQDATPASDPVNDAKAEDLKAAAELKRAQVGKVKNEMVNIGVDAEYSAVQAAGSLATMPGLAPLADQMLRSAGFQDQDEAPIVPSAPAMPAGDPAAMMPDQPLPIDQVGPEGVAPVEAGMNLAGGVPDASGPDGMQAGIETPIIE